MLHNLSLFDNNLENSTYFGSKWNFLSRGVKFSSWKNFFPPPPSPGIKPISTVLAKIIKKKKIEKKMPVNNYILIY